METRFTTGATNSPLTDIVARALAETGGWSVPAMRGPGFRLLQNTLEAPDQNGFRALAPLNEKAQVVLDNAVVEVGLDRLTFVADLLARGLTYKLADPLSVTQLEWYSTNKVGNAIRTMNPNTRQENFLPDRLQARLPVYLTTSGFDLDIRTLKMSQRVGMPLDTANIKSGTRAVNESIEDAAINGATTLDGQPLVDAGYSAPGLLNAPNAATKSNLTAAAWSTVPVGATVFNETQAMLALLRANKKFGPYCMYVSLSINAALDSDYDTTSGSRGLTIRERLLKLEGLEAIRPADFITDGNASTHVGAKVAIVQMTSDVVDIVVGQPPTVIPWTSLNGFTFHNLIMAIMVPRFRSDYNSKSGVCIGTLA
jgi:hypothetical protein